jgi:hypothetical protein
MAEEPTSNPGGNPGEPHSYFQNFQHNPVAARVPEKIGRGVFSTGVMVLQTNEIFVLDFLSMLVQPQQVVARVIMTANSYAQFLGALRVNAGNYQTHFGPLKAHVPQAVPSERPAGESPHPMPPVGESVMAMPMPETPRGDQPPTIAATPITELYEQVKFPEDLLGGAFANAVMIRHSPEEFLFDFIGNLFPRPVVAARVFLAAGHIPALVEAMTGSWQRFQQEHGGPMDSPEPPVM